MDELDDLGIEDPDWQHVPPELRAADGQRVRVEGEQRLTPEVEEAMERADAEDEDTEDRFPSSVKPQASEGRDGSLFIAPEFFAWAARRRADGGEA